MLLIYRVNLGSSYVSSIAMQSDGIDAKTGGLSSCVGGMQAQRQRTREHCRDRIVAWKETDWRRVGTCADASA